MGAKHIETISNKTKTTKMNKPKFNIDAHAYWLLCEGQQVEVDGQKIQLTIVDEAKKTIDLHTDSWAVYNDGSQRFKDTVIKWLKDKGRGYDGNNSMYYGKDTKGRLQYWSNDENFTHILTLDEFCDLAKNVPCSDVTDTPPLPSLKYEDCFERVKPKWFVDSALEIKQSILVCNDNVTTERQAKQLAATIKLMTIMFDANGGEWIPNNGEQTWTHYIERANNVIKITECMYTASNPIYFRDYETAQRAYEANKEIFHDYFGINE